MTTMATPSHLVGRKVLSKAPLGTFETTTGESAGYHTPWFLAREVIFRSFRGSRSVRRIVERANAYLGINTLTI
jgi:hypothetical protein